MTQFLGRSFRERITGFVGVAIADTTFLSGCRRLLLQPRGLDKDGVPRSAHSFDLQQLEPTSDDVVQFDNSETPGGPQAEPDSGPDPARA